MYLCTAHSKKKIKNFLFKFIDFIKKKIYFFIYKLSFCKSTNDLYKSVYGECMINYYIAPNFIT